MIGLQTVTHIAKTDTGFAAHELRGNWQGFNAMKTAGLGNMPDNAIVVRIPLDILGSVVIRKNDLIVKGTVQDVTSDTEKQIYEKYGSSGIIRVRAVRLCDGLSERVNHLEVTGS